MRGAVIPTSVHKGFLRACILRRGAYSSTLPFLHTKKHLYWNYTRIGGFIMDISYEIVSPKEQEANVVQMGGGCYTKCEVNTDYGADYWCCERIKSA